MENHSINIKQAIHVSQTCLCLQLQKAARKVARLFDDAFRDIDLSHGQFSLLMMLMQPTPPNVGGLAAALAMDRTTLTANLKPLQRNGFITVFPDPKDGRGKCIKLTESGEALLAMALPRWECVQQQLTENLTAGTLNSGEALQLIAQLKQVAK
jgi:DNA-binding MarR family transcriptional regulator